MNLGEGASIKYYKIEPNGAELEYLDNATLEKVIIRYYEYGREWTVPHIFIQGNDGDTKDSVFWLIQENYPEYFDELINFERDNGVIRVNVGVANLNYKLKEVIGHNHFNEYYTMGVTIEEYYISKEKL